MANKLPSVFITYNPKSEFERTLAFRLHTLGAVHGYKMYLPDRTIGGKKVSNESRIRIQLADYFILFSTTVLSDTVKEEIEIAWNHLHDKSRIIIIYDGDKNLTGTEHCTEIAVDSDKMTLEEITKSVLQEIHALNKTTVVPSKNPVVGIKQEGGLIGALLVAGLGLLLLGALMED